ncbi:uncharacterized protein LOC111384654 [Olea europaea var. sylvestris]|uniref:uncharacterized protein LOC111384654 n=1 Tax=Olea europaea var. sylvestris TaxID=158386 RepID=UPI000C1D14C1|nr:uncharacterized protein LOC111384654 [Olea europaea var. sylvestris]
MALVDYASSSEDDEPRIEAGQEQEQVKVTEEKLFQSQDDHSTRFRKSSGLSLTKKTEKISNQPECSELQLPDASLLLDSPAFSSHLVTDSDHSSRVGVAMAENASRKRALNCSPASHVRSKVPKGTLPPPKNVPDTVGGHLLPPQLTGRKNVVTEDISKLFVRKHANT